MTKTARWAWRVDGACAHKGLYADSGWVDADSAPGVLEWLATTPLWNYLDGNQRFTVIVERLPGKDDQ